MCQAACINIYVDINIDKNAPYALLSILSIHKSPVIQASSHYLASPSVHKASNSLGRPPAHLRLNGHSSFNGHTAK